MARINKCIDLMERGETIYVTLKIPELSYDAGRDQAQTWADLIAIDLEHLAYDIIGLTQFMRGLKDGGPTASGHLDTNGDRISPCELYECRGGHL